MSATLAGLAGLAAGVLVGGWWRGLALQQDLAALWQAVEPAETEPDFDLDEAMLSPKYWEDE